MSTFRTLFTAAAATGVVATWWAAPVSAQLTDPTTSDARPGLFVDFGGGYMSMGAADWSPNLSLGNIGRTDVSRFDARLEGESFHGLIGYGFGSASLPLLGSNLRFIMEGTYFSGDQSQSTTRDATSTAVTYRPVSGAPGTSIAFLGAGTLVEEQTNEGRLYEIAMRLAGDHRLGGGARTTTSVGLVVSRKQQEFAYSSLQSPTGSANFRNYVLDEELDTDQLGPEIGLGYTATVGSALQFNLIGRLAWLFSNTELTAVDGCNNCSPIFNDAASALAADDSQSSARATLLAGVIWTPMPAWSLSLNGFAQYDSDVATVVNPVTPISQSLDPTSPAFIDYSSEWTYGVNGAIAFRF